MSTSDNLVGPISQQRKKAELQTIARALGISDSGTVPALVLIIKAHLEQHPLLFENPRFQGLFQYRPRGAGEQKTSADKAAEDLFEQGKDHVTTGASKKLLDAHVTTDPPPQFERLGGTMNYVRHSDRESPNEGDAFQGSSGPPSPSDIYPEEEDGLASGPPLTPKISEPMRRGVPVAGAMVHPDADVLVNFLDRHDPSAPRQEVYINRSHIMVEKVASQSGEVIYGRLSELLPAAIHSSTPIKERGGRLFRPGREANSAFIDLGAVDTIISEKPSEILKISRVNRVPLDASDDGLLLCDVFLDTSSQPKGSAIATQRRPASVSFPQAPASSLAADNSHSTPSTPGSSFIAWLRDKLDGRENEWPKALTAGDVLTRFLAVRDAIDKLREWGWARSAGGYQVPKTEEEYGGLQFVKGDVLEAFSLKHTQANSDAALFSADIAKVQNWVKSPHADEFERFRTMKIRDFKRYCQEKKAKKVSGKRKKQHRLSSGSSDESPGPKTMKGKGKAKENTKARRVIDSDDMDDTE